MMSFVRTIFKKDILDLNISDIRTFFESEQEETSVMEFKSGNVEIIDLYKEITAFLNTEGGLLIIGTPQEIKQKIGDSIKTVCFGELTYSKFRNKDWLYQKISSNIVPAPNGLNIFEHIDSAGSIFVIDVPQSIIPPHQCSSDGRYYIRLEREAKPAPHGLIQALFQKRRLPVLDATIEIFCQNQNKDKIIVNLRNNSSIPADKIGFIVEIYNVNNLESRFEVNGLSDLLGYKYSINGNTDKVLVQIMSIPIEFFVSHKTEEYIVFVSYWCKETDFDFKFWTYNPQTMEVVCEDKLQFEKIKFIDEVQRVTKIKIPDEKLDLKEQM